MVSFFKGVAAGRFGSTGGIPQRGSDGYILHEAGLTGPIGTSYAKSGKQNCANSVKLPFCGLFQSPAPQPILVKPLIHLPKTGAYPGDRLMLLCVVWSPMSFASLGLSDPIVRAVTERGYTIPTPIQSQAIPAVLAGGDLLAGAQTGTCLLYTSRCV